MFKTILHATDLATNHYKLCQQARLIANTFQANFYLLHVIELPSSLQFAQSLGFAELAIPDKTNAETVLSILADDLDVNREHLLVETGSPLKHITTKIAELAADLVIIGSHQAGGKAIAGSTAHALIQHAPCHVLMLKPFGD
ncbi:MAG: universal stress protein UspA [Legionellaceae bacterium]|nr:universal stress protein UspA [Legionellaceae bacterium]HAF87974.1 universal stress protein UspA [Legionellales bacterium]HCA89033.1 universal stress protein UspA [Legionellales bacterium]|tara:strand:- start:238 stop:663 length:426 start_codon:yes stop_codon:yes gene_type:complete